MLIRAAAGAAADAALRSEKVVMDKKRAGQLINANRASFLVAGGGIAAWAPMIPYVQERFALDPQQLGLLLLCIGIGSFCSMPLTGFLASRLGCRTLIYSGVCVLSACLIAITLVQQIYVMAAVLFIFGISSVILDVTSNINAARVELMVGRPIMSGLHGLYSVGGFAGSLSVTFALSAGSALPVTGCIAAALCLAVVFAGCRHVLTAANAAVEGESADGTGRALHPLVLLIGVLCFIMFMTEGSMLDWSGVFLNKERGVSIEHAGYGYAAFAIAMTIFRLTGDKIVSMLGRRRTLCTGTLLIFCGYSLAVMIPHPLTTLCGFFMIGMGASNVVPQLISYTVSIKSVSINAAVTVVNAIGFTGILCGPALIGFAAQHIGLPQTFMVMSAFVLMVGIIVFTVMRPVKHKTAA